MWKEKVGQLVVPIFFVVQQGGGKEMGSRLSNSISIKSRWEFVGISLDFCLR
jgi:hypothetical protein